MSGSPPLPPLPLHETAGWAHGRPQRHAYRGMTVSPGAGVPERQSIDPRQHHQQHHQQSPDARQQNYPPLYPPHPPSHPPPQPPTPHPFARPYYRSDDPPGLPPPSASSSAYGPASGPAYPYLPPLPGPGSMQQGYPIPVGRPPPPQAPSPIPTSASAPGSDISQPYDSPKSQRKAKGHVASACVPCKRAHLRCDSQRPCSRCLSNGKEDACVDVQHKKRGRPRLREERDLRYLARGAMADANVYPPLPPPPPPLSGYSRPTAPVAYLTTDLEVAKASSAFCDAIGHAHPAGLHLADLVRALDGRRIQLLQRQLYDERQRKDPQYLPPIFSAHDRDRVMEELGFDDADVRRFSLDWHEYLTFVGPDHRQRAFAVRLGLAKRASIYFVVLLLHIEARPLAPPTPSPQPRDAPYSYGQQQQQQQQQQKHAVMYTQPTPVSAAFEINRMPSSQSLSQSQSQSQSQSGYSGYSGPGSGSGSGAGAGPGSGAGSNYTGYSAAPRSDYYQTPRSEIGLVARPHRQPTSDYHLPPIRSPHERSEYGASSRSDTRVDIGGLIEQPSPPRRPEY